MAPLLSNQADGDVAAEEAVDEALPAEDDHLFGSADEMYEDARGRGQDGRLLLPDLVANAAGDNDGDRGSGRDDGGLFLAPSRLAFRAMLEHERGRDWRIQLGFPADRSSFASSSFASWGRFIPTLLMLALRSLAMGA